ncbi:MAG: adenosine deaminase [Anaerolineae bacterium]|nr:adenosine deaminase [Anaerolineae bacterium]
MKNFDPKYNGIPKTEIHVHLEGAIRTATIIDIAREHGLELPAYDVEGLDPHVKVHEQWESLDAVLGAFNIAQMSIASPEAFERIAWEFFEDSARQNVRLLEVRFSPDWAFSGHNLDWDAALEGLLHAKARAKSAFGMAIGLIAITSRSMGVDSCEKTIDWAIRHRELIHGIDLADSEAQHPISEFIRPVLRAKDAGLGITIHSGEDTPASAVIETIQAVSPDRIGHGIHIIEDMKAVEMVIEQGITLEVNPWSNYLTSAVPTIESHPLKQLFDLGVRVTINSDDPEVLETNLNNEYRIAHEVLGMSLEEIEICNRFAVEASFLSGPEKRGLMANFFPLRTN